MLYILLIYIAGPAVSNLDRDLLRDVSSKLDMVLINQHRILNEIVPGEGILQRPENCPPLPLRDEDSFKAFNEFLKDKIAYSQFVSAVELSVFLFKNLLQQIDSSYIVNINFFVFLRSVILVQTLMILISGMLLLVSCPSYCTTSLQDKLAGKELEDPKFLFMNLKLRKLYFVSIYNVMLTL